MGAADMTPGCHIHSPLLPPATTRTCDNSRTNIAFTDTRECPVVVWDSGSARRAGSLYQGVVEILSFCRQQMGCRVGVSLVRVPVLIVLVHSHTLTITGRRRASGCRRCERRQRRGKQTQLVSKLIPCVLIRPSPQIKLHPLVIINISEHFTRIRAQHAGAGQTGKHRVFVI